MKIYYQWAYYVQNIILSIVKKKLISCPINLSEQAITKIIKIFMKKTSLLTLGITSIALSLQAGGFQLFNQGIEQASMGGTGVAYPYNAASMFYNPALLSRMNNFQVNGSLMFSNPNMRFVSDIGPTQNNNIKSLRLPYSIYIGGKTNPESNWGFGIGVFTPFAHQVDWGTQWSGRFVNQSYELNTTFIQPTISYKISDVVSIGAGFNYALAQLNISRSLPVMSSSSEGISHLEAKGQGIGFNVGINIVPTDDISIGLNFRSGVDLSFKNGMATYNVPNSLVNSFPNSNFSTEMNLPHVATLGIAGRLTPDFILTADLAYSTWSRFQYTNYDFEINTPLVEDETWARHYDNSLSLRLGTCYYVNGDFSVMAGAYYEQSPSKKNYTSADLFDGNKYGFSFGVQYEPISKLKMNAGLSYYAISSRNVIYEPSQFGGTYQVKSLTPGIGFSYKFID